MTSDVACSFASMSAGSADTATLLTLGDFLDITIIVFVPADDYLPAVAAACREHNVLFIADEIQTGIGRTGALLRVCGDCSCAGHCERQPATYTRPDVLILGKALSGGTYPVSAVLSNSEVLGVLKPGQHGSTFGGNPLACAVARAALKVLVDEDMIGNAQRMGDYFLEGLRSLPSNLIREVRGRGLMLAIELDPAAGGARPYCLALKDEGVLAKDTHGHTIRLAPPLVINREQVDFALEKLKRVLCQ